MTYVFIVIFNSLDDTRDIEAVFYKEEDAEKYIEANGGWHSEIHSFNVEKCHVL